MTTETVVEKSPRLNKNRAAAKAQVLKYLLSLSWKTPIVLTISTPYTHLWPICSCFLPISINSALPTCSGTYKLESGVRNEKD